MRGFGRGAGGRRRLVPDLHGVGEQYGSWQDVDLRRIMFRDSLSVWRAEEQRLAVSQALADRISV